MIENFHFLRPQWLLVIPAALLLVLFVMRRDDVRRRWRKTIAPHLLDHLLVGRRWRFRLRPVHGTALVLMLGGFAAAGPSWEREQPPFVEDTAPLAIALDLSPTMDAIDIAPTRLERVKLKIRDLLKLRAGAHTALYVYAGSTHMVLPLTDDPNLMQTYVDSLATRIMPVRGKDSALALKTVSDALAHEDVPGTILFITDGIEAGAVDAFKRYAEGGKDQVLVLGAGTSEGGPVRTGPQSYLEENGRRVYARLDADALRAFKRDTGIPVATVTLDDSSDVEWVQRHVQAHLRQKQADQQTRWKDAGWALTIPIAVLGALWFRRGWTIRWAAVFVLALTMAVPPRSYAASLADGGGGWRFADLWATHDQQGRWAYEHGDYKTAAARFDDPMWRGVSAYRAGDFEGAVDAFARVDSADSWFNQGNALAHLGRYPAAIAAYEEALKQKPGWSEAQRNLDLVRALIPPAKKDDEQEQEQSPDIPPDQIQFDDQGKKGKKGNVQVPQKVLADIWMRNIQTTPTELLARKFAVQAVQQRHDARDDEKATEPAR